MTYLPRVSVVVPVYNSEATLEECINSLLELNYPKTKLELIFVNNGSIDKTTDILNRYNEKIEIVYEAKKGPAAARNKGILNSSGEIIAFTDADCKVGKDWLKKLVNPLRDERIGAVGGKILSKRPSNKIEKFGEKIHDHDRAINEFKPPYVITMNWASRRLVLMEVDLFDETFIRCEDVDLSYKISHAGFIFFYEPEAIVYHSNEKTLSGLFLEGYSHGFWAVKVLKEWKDLIKQFGHRRINIESYKEIIVSLIGFTLGHDRDSNICHFTFNFGKKIGKFIGSIRFLYLDL